jgi:hypothetical protein
VDLTLTYCPVRRSLEARNWVLVSQLSCASTRLLKLIGKNHVAFVVARAECEDLRKQITRSERHLLDHRNLHRC